MKTFEFFSDSCQFTKETPKSKSYPSLSVTAIKSVFSENEI